MFLLAITRGGIMNNTASMLKQCVSSLLIHETCHLIFCDSVRVIIRKKQKHYNVNTQSSVQCIHSSCSFALWILTIYSRPGCSTAQQEIGCQTLESTSCCLDAASFPHKMSSGSMMAFRAPHLIVQSSYLQSALPLSSSDISWHVRDIKCLMKGQLEASSEISNLDTCECSAWFPESGKWYLALG